VTVPDLKTELAAILSFEEAADPNWAMVEFLSAETYARLTDPDTMQDFPREDVIAYLAGFLRRRLDKGFGDQQRQWLRSFLRTS